MAAAAYQQFADIDLGFAEVNACADKRRATFGAMW
jgi:hypothetical protein